MGPGLILFFPRPLASQNVHGVKLRNVSRKNKQHRGGGVGGESHSSSLPLFLIIFSSIFLRAALHCPNAWNRLLTKAVQSLFMFLSIIRKREYYNFPQVELKMFLERKARATHFLCFRFRLQSEREAYYRNRKREEKDFEKD